MSGLESFHFLRPVWLLALVPAALLLWRLTRGDAGRRSWQRVIAPHLLAELLVGGEDSRRRLRPVHLLAAFWGLGILALAGPAWQREPAPFAEDEAALVIALEVTPTMLAQDVQPSRLERAVHKIGDLAARRPGARTALVAYAGSAHRVLPLTRDAGILKQLAAELSPDLLPVPGNATADAVALANRLLRDSGRPGSILLMADAIPAGQWQALSAQRDARGAPVHVLAVAAGPEVVPPPGSPPAPALDAAAMAAAARAAGGALTPVSVDDADVEQLARELRRSVVQAASGEGDRWRDAGAWLLGPLAAVVLAGFRRGFSLGEA